MYQDNPQEGGAVSIGTAFIGDPPAAGWGILAPHPGVWMEPGECSFGRPGEIHVFRAPLCVDEKRCWRYFALLDSVERVKAGRFHFPHDRNRYVAAHGALREILGAYAGIAPEAVEFRSSKHGKPALANSRAGRSIEFNMSHSGDIALIALSTVGPLGVDVEFVREGSGTEDLARGCLSPRETDLLAELPVHERVETLYRWWTRKEALAKAVGEGLARAFTRLQVVPPFLTDKCSAASEAAPWCVWDISPQPGYVATLVASGPGRPVTLMAHEPQGLIA